MRSFSEELNLFGEPLLEMANAIQKYTGLPGVVYFSTKAEAGVQKSLGRVKWMNAGKAAFITIKADGDGKRKGGGDPRMVALLEKFVAANEEILWEYWNTSPENADAASTMQRFVKV